MAYRQERLLAFENDAAVAVATYRNGAAAAYNPALDGGGLGDLFGKARRGNGHSRIH